MVLPVLDSDPLVSILVTCRNKDRFIREAIESGLDQDYPNVEVIVCDDGSIDQSGAVIADITGIESRVHAVRTPGIGPAGATNAAFKECSGEVVCLLDGDDLFERDHVTDVLELFRRVPLAGLCIGPARLIGETGTEDLGVTPWMTSLPSGWLAHLLVGPTFDLPTVLLTSTMSIRRAPADRIFPLPGDGSVAGRGSSTTLRTQDAYIGALAILMTEVVSATRPTVRYRVHPGQFGAVADGDLATAERSVRDFELTYEHVQNAFSELFPQAKESLGSLEGSFYYAEAKMTLARRRGDILSALRYSYLASRTGVYKQLPMARRTFFRLYPLLPTRVSTAFGSPKGLARRLLARRLGSDLRPAASDD